MEYSSELQEKAAVDPVYRYKFILFIYLMYVKKRLQTTFTLGIIDKKIANEQRTQENFAPIQIS